MEEQQQGRDHIHGGHGEGQADLSAVDVGEKDGKGLAVRILQKDQRLLHHVPVVDEHQNGDGVQRAAALRQAEKITEAGILAMMKASKPGMYEYQYKAEFDRAIGQFGPLGPGFPSIISAGANNFCIHYYAYTGQAQDGDMILNDVGAQYDNLITDVSRGFPCNGRFTDRQKLLYECALQTSNHMFSIIRPGMKMKDVDATIRSYNAQLLKDSGVLKDLSEIGKVMWHGGAHHIGFDVHDAIMTPERIAPNMVFCVDVGIYHEEWGIGFRVEDNCLVTDNGCENLSANIVRTVPDIEEVMRK